MEHAGFDGLHNPFGAMLVCVSLLFLTAIIMFGAFMVKLAMRREKAMRAEMRQAREDRKLP
jgi:hypothetical protein